MSKKLVNTLYKKCFDFSIVKQKSKPQPESLASIIDWSGSQRGNDMLPKITEVLWKDTLSESRAYLQMLQKLAEMYDHVLDKAQFFRKFVGQIFLRLPRYHFLNRDALFKGFFFIFVYKDFIVREIVQRVQDQLHQKSMRNTLAKIEQDYEKFMEADLTCWVSILLECEVFESYQSIVAPNEQVQTNRQKQRDQPQSLLLSKPLHIPQPRRNQYSCLVGETANYIALQKRYIKGFLAAYYRFTDTKQKQSKKTATNPTLEALKSRSIRNTAMYLVDSDFDTEEDGDGNSLEGSDSCRNHDEIPEIISNQIADSFSSDRDLLQGKDDLDLNDNFFTRQAAKLAKNIFLPDKKPIKTGAKKKETDKNIVQENSGGQSGTNPSAQALKNKKKKLRRKAKKERAQQQQEQQSQQTICTHLEELQIDTSSESESEKPEALVLETDDADDDLCDEEIDDEGDDDSLEDCNSEPTFEFFKDFTVTKPIEGTNKTRERRIMAFGKGNKLMGEEMANLVSQLANFGHQKQHSPSEMPIAEKQLQEQEQKQLKPEKQPQQQQPASFISERRNKKRKELVQSIFDASPFAINPRTGSPQSHKIPQQAKQMLYQNIQEDWGVDQDLGAANANNSIDAKELPDQLGANMPKAQTPPPWKPKHKSGGQSSQQQVEAGEQDKSEVTTGKVAQQDDILEVSSDEMTINDKDLQDSDKHDQSLSCVDAAANGAAAEEKKKKKNRRKKRTRKQKQLLLQQQVLELNGKCTCECHSDLAAVLARETTSQSEAAGDKSNGASTIGQTVADQEPTGTAAQHFLTKSQSGEGDRSAQKRGGSKVVGWSGCSHERGCQADGDCAQEDEKLNSNEDGAALMGGGGSESDVEFEEQLRNFELRLSQQHLLCASAVLAKPNSLTLHAEKRITTTSTGHSSQENAAKNGSVNSANQPKSKKTTIINNSKKDSAKAAATAYKPQESDSNLSKQDVTKRTERPKLRPNVSSKWLGEMQAKTKRVFADAQKYGHEKDAAW